MAIESGQQGPQSPAAAKQGSIAQASGTAYEVFSVSDMGQRKRLQVWRDRGKAYDHIKQLKKIFGPEFKCGIRPIEDRKGDLFSQSVRKCRAILGQPDIAKAGGEGSRGGHVIGHTRSGRPVYAHVKHRSHSDFTADDHTDAGILHHKLADMHAAATSHRAIHVGRAHSHRIAGDKHMELATALSAGNPQDELKTARASRNHVAKLRHKLEMRGLRIVYTPGPHED